MSEFHGVEFRILPPEEFHRLEEPLERLAAYHNRVVANFSGLYPILPLDRVLKEAADRAREGKARAEAIFAGENIVGFCKASHSDRLGAVDWLYVDEDRRGMGLGAALLDNAMAFLRGNGVRLVDIKVVHGNSAKRFYERHGFVLRTEIVSMELRPASDAGRDTVGEAASFNL